MKYLRKILIAFTLLTAFNSSVFAQQDQDNDPSRGRKRIKALYVAYITQELNLTETEAQQFWPVHMGYENEIKAINEKNLPELDREESVLGVKKKYKDRFAKVLGAQRTDDFYRKDAEFRKKLIERLKERRKEGGRQQPGFRRQGMQPPPPPED